jgi:potassium-transporting ATPase KdpC subunit
MRSFLTGLRQLSAALRMLLVFTVITGVLYPLAVTAVAQLPGLRSRADGSLLTSGGRVIGSKLLGQSFTDAKGDPLPQYLQSRPSAASYDPTASGAGNLGPESVVDVLPDPKVKDDTGTPSLLTQVCTRSLAVGKEFGVDGARRYCTPSGVGAVLAVFHAGPGYRGAITRVVSVNEACPATPFLAAYRGVTVQCATPGGDYASGEVVPVAGDAPAHPAVPADAVTASGSGLDPEISPAYAALQEATVARARGIAVAQVAAIVSEYEYGRDLGVLGERRVNVLQANAALDRRYPYSR